MHRDMRSRLLVQQEITENSLLQKNINVPMMRICGQTDANYRFFLKNSSAFRNMIPSASSFDIPFSRKYP